MQNLGERRRFAYGGKCSFPTSYLEVKSVFSRVLHLLPKARNRLDIENRGNLRFSLTTLQSDIQKVVRMHQTQVLLNKISIILGTILIFILKVIINGFLKLY